MKRKARTTHKTFDVYDKVWGQPSLQVFLSAISLLRSQVLLEV